MVGHFLGTVMGVLMRELCLSYNVFMCSMIDFSFIRFDELVNTLD